MNRKFLRFPTVRNVTGKSRTAIYMGMADGTFPRQIKIGPRTVAWDSEAIEKWMRDRIESTEKRAIS